MVEGIAQGFGYSCRPGPELFIIGGAASNVFFIDPVGAHGPPFVMIAVEPDLGQILKIPVAGNLRYRQVAVIVNDRLIFGVFVVKYFRRFVLDAVVPLLSNFAADL